MWVQTLINFNNKVNAITLGYVLKLDLKVRLTNVRVHKIEGSNFKMFEIVLASFQVKNKLKKA